MEKNLKAAMSEDTKLNEAFSAETPAHPLMTRVKELAIVNEMERQSLESLQEKIVTYESSFEELKVG